MRASTPDPSPQPSPQNGAKPSPALKPSPGLLAARTAPEFVPGKLDLGAQAFVPGGEQEGAKQAQQEEDKKPNENGAPLSPTKALESKRPAALSVENPSSTPPTPVAPTEPEPFSGRFSGKVKVDVEGKRYSLRVMKLLQHDQKYLDMEHPDTKLTQHIEEFRKLLEQSPELDSAKDMPDRKQAEGGRGTPRGGPGTPKGGRGKNNLRDQPLRDRTGKVMEVCAHFLFCVLMV